MFELRVRNGSLDPINNLVFILWLSVDIPIEMSIDSFAKKDVDQEVAKELLERALCFFGATYPWKISDVARRDADKLNQINALKAKVGENMNAKDGLITSLSHKLKDIIRPMRRYKGSGPKKEKED